MFGQRTIREKVQLTGVGLHTGKQIRVEILPAPEDSGISFVRTDLPPHPELRALAANVVSTTLATTLAGPGASVATVEHLLAALVGSGVDNARVLVDGPEIPILDGSAGPFVDMLLAAGIEKQRKSRRFLVIRREVKVSDGHKTAKLSPGAGLRIRCSLDFDHPLIAPKPYTIDVTERSFQKDIAQARTFGFYHEVEALRARGLALGGSLENAVVIDGYQVLNPEGLRHPDEFVRHKVLDAIGDLALFGMPLIGRVHLHKAGHALHVQLVRATLADPRAYDIVEPAGLPETESVRDESPYAVFETAESIA